jgi:hypothetical protein
VKPGAASPPIPTCGSANFREYSLILNELRLEKFGDRHTLRYPWVFEYAQSKAGLEDKKYDDLCKRLYGNGGKSPYKKSPFLKF